MREYGLKSWKKKADNIHFCPKEVGRGHNEPCLSALNGVVDGPLKRRQGLCTLPYTSQRWFNSTEGDPLCHS